MSNDDEWLLILPILITRVPMTRLDPTAITPSSCARLLERVKVNAEERSKNDPVGKLGIP